MTEKYDSAYQEALRIIKDALARGKTRLRLSGMRLTLLPPEIGLFANLTWLHLSDNQLTSLPADIAQLADLEFLDVGNNQLTSFAA